MLESLKKIKKTPDNRLSRLVGVRDFFGADSNQQHTAGDSGYDY
ncbi:MAG: hypothetical protein K0Q94_3231 [Paenibacillus sp.]|nr:hypothetical protein [Paenibacillus sp.]